MSYSSKMILLYAIVLFLDLLEMTLLNVGLPSIAHGLGVSVDNINTIVTAFIWGLTMTIPLAGWLGKRFGDKRIFILGQLVFLGASAACFFAQTLSHLVILRTIQGFGGGIIMPVGLALLMKTLSAKERAGATGKISLVLRIAPALGPILAGYILANLSWRWLFLLKLPISVLCLLASIAWIPKDDVEVETKPFDWKGLLFCSASLGALLMAFSNADNIEGWGWAGLSVISFSCFLRVEKQAEAPIIPLQLFNSRIFCQSNLLESLVFCTLYGSSFLFSPYFQENLGFDSVETGWVLASSTVGMFLAIPIFATLYNRIGPQPLVIGGFILLSISLTLLISTPSSATFWLVSCFMVALGLGGSLVISTNATTVFTEISKELMVPASSVYSLVRQIANCLGIAISSVLLAITAKYTLALALLLPLTILGLLVSIKINNGKVLKAIAKE